MIFVGVVARLGLAALLAIGIARPVDARTDVFQPKPHAKAKLLAAIHRGMPRAAFYAAARSAGVEPGNPDYVKFGKHGGPPTDNGTFPMPNRTHAHPPVSVFIFYAATGCAIPTDEIHVTFDSNDRVAT